LASFLDAAAPALLVAQSIGRFGNYFNQELLGGPTTLPWGLEIDPAHRPVGYEGLYVAGYSGFRVFEELLRVDPAHHLFGLRLNLYVAAVLCLIGLAWFARSQRAPGRVKKVNGPALLAAGAIALLSGCGHTAQRDETHLRGSPISQLRIPEPAVMSPGGQAPISKPPGVVEFPHVPV
jgi:hypothetical protein